MDACVILSTSSMHVGDLARFGACGSTASSIYRYTVHLDRPFQDMGKCSIEHLLQLYSVPNIRMHESLSPHPHLLDILDSARHLPCARTRQGFRESGRLQVGTGRARSSIRNYNVKALVSSKHVFCMRCCSIPGTRAACASQRCTVFSAAHGLFSRAQSFRVHSHHRTPSHPNHGRASTKCFSDKGTSFFVPHCPFLHHLYPRGSPSPLASSWQLVAIAT